MLFLYMYDHKLKYRLLLLLLITIIIVIFRVSYNSYIKEGYNDIYNFLDSKLKDDFCKDRNNIREKCNSISSMNNDIKNISRSVNLCNIPSCCIPIFKGNKIFNLISNFKCVEGNAKNGPMYLTENGKKLEQNYWVDKERRLYSI